MEYNKPRYNPKIHHRRSIRLKGYDYSQAGLYFITICSQNRICRFGEIVTATMILNHAGKMVDDEWLALVDRFPNIVLHEYSIMPNHFHCILEIVSNNSHVVGVPLVGTQTGNGDIITGQNVGACPNDKITTGRNVRACPCGRPNGDITIGRPQGYAPTDDTQRNNAETMLGTQNDDGAPKNKTIGDMMDAFKSITTVKYIRGVRANPCGCLTDIKCMCGGWKPFDGKIWQRDYFEHIIRDEESYLRISEYIKNNPAKWENDKFYTP